MVDKNKESKSLGKVTDKVQDKEMSTSSSSAAAMATPTSAALPKIKPNAVDQKLLSAEFVNYYYILSFARPFMLT